MNYQVLRTEIDTDPLGRGYSGMTDQEIADDINTIYRTRENNILTSSQIYEATVVSEFQSASVEEKQYVRDIWGLGGDVDIGPGSKARNVYAQVFGVGSATVANLVDVTTEDVSRGVELNLGTVRESDVYKAKSL